MAHAPARQAGGGGARFLDFWRFSAVFWLHTGIRVFMAAPRVSRPAARASRPAQFARHLFARHLFAVKILKNTNARAPRFLGCAPP